MRLGYVGHELSRAMSCLFFLFALGPENKCHYSAWLQSALKDVPRGKLHWFLWCPWQWSDGENCLSKKMRWMCFVYEWVICRRHFISCELIFPWGSRAWSVVKKHHQQNILEYVKVMRANIGANQGVKLVTACSNSLLTSPQSRA